MRLEIIKKIKLTGIGLKQPGESIDIEDESGNILIQMGFGKVSEITDEDAEVIAEIEAEEKEAKPKRVRRTKEQIELDKNK